MHAGALRAIVMPDFVALPLVGEVSCLNHRKGGCPTLRFMRTTSLSAPEGTKASSECPGARRIPAPDPDQLRHASGSGSTTRCRDHVQFTANAKRIEIDPRLDGKAGVRQNQPLIMRLEIIEMCAVSMQNVPDVVPRPVRKELGRNPCPQQSPPAPHRPPASPAIGCSAFGRHHSATFTVASRAAFTTSNTCCSRARMARAPLRPSR